MSYSFSFLFLLAAVVFGQNNVDKWVYENPCAKWDSCSCVLHNGSVINIAGDGFNNGSARFSMMEYEKDRKDNKYSYNPCYPFTDTSTEYLTLEPPCQNVAGCWYEQISSVLLLDKKIKTGFGSQQTAKYYWEKWNKSIGINYTISTAEGKVINTLKVIFRCSHQAFPNVSVFSAKKDILVLNYYSNCSCLDGCPVIVTDEKNALFGPLAIALIVICSLTFAYLIFGIFWNFTHGASGKYLLPNYTFWSSIPNRLKNCCSSSPSYDSF